MGVSYDMEVYVVCVCLGHFVSCCLNFLVISVALRNVLSNS